MLDIIILIIIAFFLFKKLRDILGEENHSIPFNAPKKDKKVKNVTGVVLKEESPVKINPIDGYEYLDNNSKKNISDISLILENFSLNLFAKIATSVVENMINAYNSKDIDYLSNILNKEMLEIIKLDINESDKTIHLISINIDKILSVTKVGSLYTIDILFDIEQHITSRNQIDNHKINKIKEKWSFTNDIKKKTNHKWLVSNIE